MPLARLLSTDIEGPSHFITGQCPIELLRGRDLPVNCAAAGALPTRAYTSQVLSILILSLRDDDCQFRHSIGISAVELACRIFSNIRCSWWGASSVLMPPWSMRLSRMCRETTGTRSEQTRSAQDGRRPSSAAAASIDSIRSPVRRSAAMLHRQTGHSLPTEMPPGRSLSLPSSCWYRAPPSDNPRGVSSVSTRIGSGR